MPKSRCGLSSSMASKREAEISRFANSRELESHLCARVVPVTKKVIPRASGANPRAPGVGLRSRHLVTPTVRYPALIYLTTTNQHLISSATSGSCWCGATSRPGEAPRRRRRDSLGKTKNLVEQPQALAVIGRGMAIDAPLLQHPAAGLAPRCAAREEPDRPDPSGNVRSREAGGQAGGCEFPWLP